VTKKFCKGIRFKDIMSGSESPKTGMIHPENILTFVPQVLTVKKLTVEHGYKDGSTWGPDLYGNPYAMVALQKWAVYVAQAVT